MKLYPVTDLQILFENELSKIKTDLQRSIPQGLYLPIDYSLEMGGKRIRPLLLLLSYNLFSDKIENAIPAALAIEVFHNFTLLHDDIMDKADVRRNQPTVHKKFNENNAILSGDAMAFLAYRYLLSGGIKNQPEVLELFTRTAIEVCEGQQFDMEFETRTDVTEIEYIEMIRLKTAVLLACSLKLGGLIANAGEIIASRLYDFGINLGLAFQLQDDLLDSFGDQKSFGKMIGGDIAANKKTFLLIKALEHADNPTKIELQNWIQNPDFNQTEKINAVLEIYNRLNIKEITQNKIDSYFNTCSEIFETLEIETAKKETLKYISNKMMNRVS
jgi:geranylgeranyl diphosphate synthase type II